MSIVSKLTQLLAEARSEQARVDAKLQGLLQRREDLLTMPLEREEFITIVEQWIDQSAAEQGKHYGKHLLEYKVQGLVNHPLKSSPPKDLNPFVLFAEGVNPAVALLLLRDHVKAGVRAALEAANWPEQVGPPRAERIKELAELDAEIGQLQGELEQLRQAAAGS